MTAVRVAVIDDHVMVRDGLVALLSNDARIEVVGAAGTVGEASSLLDQWQPQVLVVDDQLPDGRGTDLARQANDGLDDCSVLMISGADRPQVIDDAIEAGCSGFVSKGLGVEQLAEAVVAVSNGSSIFPAGVLRRRLNPDNSAYNITDREIEILGMLSAMYAPTEISQELGISLHTVRNHIRSILSKLEARSQLEAVIIGLRHGLIELDPTGDDAR